MLRSALVMAPMLGAVLVLLYVLIVVFTWVSLQQKAKHLPGPKPWPIFGHLPHIANVGGLPRCLKAFGAIYSHFLMYVGSRAYFITNDPELVTVSLGAFLACLQASRFVVVGVAKHLAIVLPSCKVVRPGYEHYSSCEFLK